MKARRIERLVIGIFLLAAGAIAAAPAQEKVELTEITPTLLVFATSSGNLVASTGPDGVLLVGTPSLASTPYIDSVLKQRTRSPARYGSWQGS